jgi:hypothetical protein
MGMALYDREVFSVCLIPPYLAVLKNSTVLFEVLTAVTVMSTVFWAGTP